MTDRDKMASHPDSGRSSVPAGRSSSSAAAEIPVSERPTELNTGEVRPSTHARVKLTDRGSPPAPAQDYVGCTIDDRYQVESVLGEGGMGVVYKARHKKIDKPVAIKVLRAGLARDQEVTERFMTEARAASSIGSDHIVDITDFGELNDGSTYFVMEFLDGQTLTSLIERGRVAPARALAIARQIATGLAAAHDALIVHRDLKPDNVFLVARKGTDFVKILDFGIAKVAGLQNKITRAGTIFGTPHYMSPEQAKGTPVDHRTDVYSLGVILYELLAGRVPFDGENPMSILSQHSTEPPTPLSALYPPIEEMPDGLEAVVAKCLEKAPELRYLSMKDLGEDLDRVEAGELPLAATEARPSFHGDRQTLPNKRVGAAELATVPPPAPANRTLQSVVPSPSLASAPPAGQSLAEASYTLGAPAAEAGLSQPPPPHGKPRPLLWLASGAAICAVAAVGVYYLFLAPGIDAPLSTVFEPILGRIGERVAAFPAPTTPVAPAIDQESGDYAVAIVVSPIDAEVYRGKEKLGQMPVTLLVKRDQATEIEVRRKGYYTKHMKVDGQSPRVVVRLTPSSGEAPVLSDDLGVAIETPAAADSAPREKPEAKPKTEKPKPASGKSSKVESGKTESSTTKSTPTTGLAPADSAASVQPPSPTPPELKKGAPADG